MKEKLLILFGIVLLLLVILVLRITYINATSGSKYKKQVLSQAQQKYESQHNCKQVFYSAHICFLLSKR